MLRFLAETPAMFWGTLVCKHWPRSIARPTQRPISGDIFSTQGDSEGKVIFWEETVSVIVRKKCIRTLSGNRERERERERELAESTNT